MYNPRFSFEEDKKRKVSCCCFVLGIYLLTMSDMHFYMATVYYLMWMHRGIATITVGRGCRGVTLPSYENTDCHVIHWKIHPSNRIHVSPKYQLSPFMCEERNRPRSCARVASGLCSGNISQENETKHKVSMPCKSSITFLCKCQIQLTLPV